MKRKKKNDHQLSAMDIDAIICALPLVSELEADSEEQTVRNQLACDSAELKLTTHNRSYSPEEIRVMFASVGFALDVLAGRDNPFFSPADVSPEYKRELSQFLFSYNRLYPVFDEMVSRLETKCDLHL